MVLSIWIDGTDILKLHIFDRRHRKQRVFHFKICCGRTWNVLVCDNYKNIFLIFCYLFHSLQPISIPEYNEFSQHHKAINLKYLHTSSNTDDKMKRQQAKLKVNLFIWISVLKLVYCARTRALSLNSIFTW